MVLSPRWRRRLGEPAVQLRELDGQDLYLPPGGPWPGVVLALGALREGRRYPVLVSAARSIAACGFAVLVPELGRLQELVLDTDALEDLVVAAQALPDREGVIDAPVGLIGFSLGGSLVLLAAADPRLHDRVACVGAMGAYFSLAEMVEAAVAGFEGPRGDLMPLEAPSAYAVAASLIERLQDPDQAMLAQLIDRERDMPIEALSRVDLSSVGRESQAVLRLLRTHDHAQRAALIAGVAGLDSMLTAMSPAAALDRIAAPAWILHDERDRYVPFGQFRAMREAAESRSDFTFLSLRLLEHTEPFAPGLNPLILFGDYLPGLVGLYRFAHGPLTAIRRGARPQALRSR